MDTMTATSQDEHNTSKPGLRQYIIATITGLATGLIILPMLSYIYSVIEDRYLLDRCGEDDVIWGTDMVFFGIIVLFCLLSLVCTLFWIALKALMGWRGRSKGWNPTSIVAPKNVFLLTMSLAFLFSYFYLPYGYQLPIWYDGAFPLTGWEMPRRPCE